MTDYATDPTETLTLTDTPTYNWTLAREFTETITLTETDTYATGRELTETITLTDGDTHKLSEVLTSTYGAWSATYSSRITLSDAVQDFIDALDVQQIPINMISFSCHATTSDSELEFNIVAVVKKH